MAEQLTLMDFIRELLGLEGQDKAIQLRDYFEKDPQAALHEYGLGHLSPEDVHDAIVLVQDNDTVSFDRHYDTGSNWLGAAGSGAGGGAEWAKAGSHDWQVREHVTNSHVTNEIDDRDTIVDQSTNQHVNTHGGDFYQDIDNHAVTASGDGAVAAGDDIRDSTVTTGDGNAVGYGNQVTNGDGNNTAFGSGSSAVKGVSVGEGGAFSVDGNANGDASTNGSHNQASFEDSHDTTVHDSGNVDLDVSQHYDDHSQTHVGSGNDVDLHFG